MDGEVCSPRQLLPRERRVRVPGTNNFRDMGGYLTADGTKQTRWHRLYRSDNLAATAQNRDACVYLRDTLLVGCTIDLRSADERRMTPYQIAGVLTYRISIVMGTEIAASLQAAPEGVTEKLAESLMLESYQKFVQSGTAELAQFFRLLVQRGPAHSGSESIVFHCRAGKDRTGMCAALLLIVLGVPRATVYDDYLATNAHYERPPTAGVEAALHTEVDSGAVSALFQAQLVYLTAALDVIELEHGSVHAYMRDVLGVSDADVAALQSVYLEDAEPRVETGSNP